MKTCLRLLSFIILLVSTLAAGCARTADGTLVLDDFETPASLDVWKGPISLSDEFVAHGRSAFRLDLSDPRERSLESEALPGDWSAYDFLKFDIYNPAAGIQFGSFWIFDELGDDEAAVTYGQSYRGSRRLYLNRGWTHYEIDLQKAMVENNDRPLALDRIRRFRLDFGGISGQLFIDNIRLVKGEESPVTASAIGQRDCIVRVENTVIRASLAVPFDSLLPEPQIATLRASADRAMKRLEQAVNMAEEAGWFGFYWRIPLITADIGLNIRLKLVWYQGEQEEAAILDHIIVSCNRSADEIDSLLASGAEAPPLDKQQFYARPYPRLKGLPIRDGFFRYDNGDPVILYAMHGRLNRQLQGYFAPYDHVTESYTVGGASRFDLETTPVYGAFHKYPETHRVGWDGWCGHLIKDRWSMGGKKENVVICLESDRVKEAVLEYMKTAAGQWMRNPDLLYNIMAYELMYICYCEKSQVMFRDWLREKYSELDQVNAVWGASYKDWSGIRAPECKNAAPLPDINRAAWYDWSVFNTRRFTDYLIWIKDEMRKLDPIVPICAGGTSSMLSSANSTTGIDEEMIVNEVDDVILNESGHSIIFSDLMPSLAEKKMVMVEPEAGGHVHNTLLHFLHGKSTIAKYKWDSVNPEYPGDAAHSVTTSWNISLADVDEVLRIALDVRRLNKEIAAFYGPEPEVLILYSKTSIVQVPPAMHRAGSTPYIDQLHAVWEGVRFLGSRIGFVTEKQALSGKLDRCRLLIVPAVKYIQPEVVEAVMRYVEKGGTALVVPESFLFDQYARPSDRIASLGIKITNVTLPPVLGEGELVQNYDQSLTQAILYGEVNRRMTTESADIFSGHGETLQARGLVQSLDPGVHTILARFEDGSPGLILAGMGRGKLYYLAAPLSPPDYHKIFEPLADRVGIRRDITGVDHGGRLVTGAEVRGIDQGDSWLVYASNLGGDPVEFSLKGRAPLGRATDLRSLEALDGHRVRLGPHEETIFRVEKPRGR